jgi:hypothetical protein
MHGSFAFMTNTSFGLIVGALSSHIDASRPFWANAAAPKSHHPINLNPHVDATIEYRSAELCGEDGDCGSELAVLRDGKILGSDRSNAVFMGSYEFDPLSETNAVLLRLHVPPQGQLIAGYSAGPEGAIPEVSGQFDRTAPVARTVADVAGTPLEVTITFVGALPN